MDRGVAVAPQMLAVEAAAKCLEAGGNAIDAAIAGGFVQCVVDPVMCGIGGFGTLLYRSDRSGEAALVDFVSRAGSRVNPDQWASLNLGMSQDMFGYLVAGNVNEVGYSSVAIPGTVDGFGLSHERWGSLPWRDLLQEAIKIASNGFTVTESTADFWLRSASEGRTDGPARLQITEPSAELYAPRGRPLKAGDSLVQPDQARVLTEIAEHGSRSFYEGWIARRIAEDFDRHGGFITFDDLQTFHAAVAEPVKGQYRGHDVLSAPPPSGGLMVVQMLHLLEQFDVQSAGHNSGESIRLLVEAMKFARNVRSVYGADPDFSTIPVEALSRRGYVDDIVQKIKSGAILATTSPVVESPDTTQLTVVDRNGSAVSLTHSLGYSSGVVTRGLGFMFNNYMNCFNPVPGFTDSIAPGKRRDSSMAPTILVREDRNHLVIGAPGATRISPAIVQSIVNVIDFGMSPVEAVSAPRVDCQSGPIHLEGRIPAQTGTDLRALGYETITHLANYDRYFARPQLLVRSVHGWSGGADPRGDGGTSLAERTPV